MKLFRHLQHIIHYRLLQLKQRSFPKEKMLLTIYYTSSDLYMRRELSTDDQNILGEVLSVLEYLIEKQGD